MGENTVLATVNGKKITEQEVQAFINGLGPQVAMQFQSPDGMKKVVDELVNQELMYLDAVENKFQEEETFKKELEKVKEFVLKQYAVNKLLSDVSATEGEVAKFYDDNKEQFKVPEKARASHILVDKEDKAKKIIEEIKNGLSFEEAAMKYSNCPSKNNGGDLGEFSRGKMVPEFEEVAFSIEENKLSEPVKTQFGYHIIKVQHKKEASTSALSEVKDQIAQQIVAMKQQEKYLDKTEELKNKYEVKINL